MYTDLQAKHLFRETNDKGQISYQDICRTKGEHDTHAPAPFLSDRHNRIVRMLGYCLTLGTAEAWAGFSLVAAARLEATERAALGFAVLNSLDADQARMTAAAALDAAGAPLPAFLGHMDEAQFWASLASPAELEAYCLASFRQMAPPRQAAFLRLVQGRAAA